MEAAFVNLLSPGERVLVAACGKFGERWTAIARAYGIECDALRSQTGDGVDAGALSAKLSAQRPKALFVTASETSVGVKTDLEEIVRLTKEASPDTLVVTDAITALGAFRFETGAWGVDAVVGSSQKALSLPPGLAFVSLSQRARAAAAKAKLPKFYFDLLKELDKQAAGDMAFTPAITLVIGLRAALKHFLGRGLEQVWSDVARRSRAARAGLVAMGVSSVPKSAWSESVTAGWVPDGIDGLKLLKDLQTIHGIKIAGGQNELKGKIFRISHFGPVSESDTLDCLAGLEDLLGRAGRAAAAPGARRAAESALEARA
jgi:aspartate aminotransferase-like enzyme